MNFLIIASLAIFSMSSFANKMDMKGKPVEEQKQMMNSHIDQKIEALTAAKTCIAGAKDENALKQCKEDKKEAMEDIKEGFKKQKEESYDQKEEAIDHKKDVLDQKKDEIKEEKEEVDEMTE